MVFRDSCNKAIAMAKKFPIVVLTGPRQAGKSTLAKMSFPDYRYVSLENPQNREFAQNDPQGFFAVYDKHVIIDEAQNVPALFSYIQQIVDDANMPGQFILSGSHNFLLLEKIAQTLAGRVYFMELLPFSHNEIQQIKPLRLEDEMYCGAYPRLHAMDIDPTDFYPGYIKSYVERDVRSILNVQDLRLFRKFILLLAHQAGNLFNAAQISKKLGVDGKTVARWMSILETSYIAFTLEPWYNNLPKRVVKTPKLYFYDTGLLCNLLGIRSADSILTSTYKGAIFENYIILELMKTHTSRGEKWNYYFWRDSNKNEIDLLLEAGKQLRCIEIKASLTVKPEHLKSVHVLDPFISSFETKHYIINFFNETQPRSKETILSWQDLEKIGGAHSV
jgi:predicted AAA+ superfamily ATPase